LSKEVKISLTSRALINCHLFLPLKKKLLSLATSAHLGAHHKPHLAILGASAFWRLLSQRCYQKVSSDSKQLCGKTSAICSKASLGQVMHDLKGYTQNTLKNLFINACFLFLAQGRFSK